MLDAGCLILDAGYWILDAGCWILRSTFYYIPLNDLKIRERDAEKLLMITNKYLNKQC
jgi:hypothetical protein